MNEAEKLERALRELDGLGPPLRDRVYSSIRDGIEQGINSDNWKEVLGKTLLSIVAESFTDGSETGVNRRTRGFRGALGAIFGGGRARGGPVQGNVAYLVGENGPEYLIPGQDGFIQPMQNSMNRGGTVINAPVTVNNEGVDYGQDFQRRAFDNAGYTAQLVQQQLSELLDN